jgi:hypothetical protein
VRLTERRQVRVPYLALVTTRPIPRGKELTLNYQPHLSREQTEEAPGAPEDAIRCMCGKNKRPHWLFV